MRGTGSWPLTASSVRRGRQPATRPRPDEHVRGGGYPRHPHYACVRVRARMNSDSRERRARAWPASRSLGHICRSAGSVRLPERDRAHAGVDVGPDPKAVPPGLAHEPSVFSELFLGTRGNVMMIPSEKIGSSAGMSCTGMCEESRRTCRTRQDLGIDGIGVTACPTRFLGLVLITPLPPLRTSSNLRPPLPSSV